MLGNGLVWDPEQYIHGNYFQNKVSETFRKSFSVQPFGSILDIGCGDGQYSNSLAKELKNGQILGIDDSEEMIKYANQHWACKNLFFEVHSIEEFHPAQAFDFALSFWCLHWTNIDKSFPNIFHALKNGGQLYAVFSSFSNNSVLQIWHELAKQGPYQDLAKEYINLNKQYTDFFYRVTNTLNKLPFKQVKLNLKTARVSLPHIDYFKNFLLTMPFMKTFSSEIDKELIEAMLSAFQNMCQRKYGSELYYETRPIFLEAIK